MSQQERISIWGMQNNLRIESRVLEEKIQEAVEKGFRKIEVRAFGQHGIGGRLWKTGDEKVLIDINGYPGQRVGAMGSPRTFIHVHGPCSDDVGWLNAGATITVHGDATNGVGNAMAQGKVYVAGDIGARGMTMTKSNPRYTPPELWVLGGVGDSFAEFMAGGTAVICGYNSHYEGNILGHRPCVGMVGGRIFFRGPCRGFSQADAKLVEISDDDWKWLTTNLKDFLKTVGRTDLFGRLAKERSDWQMLVALLPHEKTAKKRMPMKEFRADVWDSELGRGGLIGDLTDMDRGPIPVLTTGDMRRFVPSWENHKYLPPCQAGCPTGIPVQQRWELIRNGRIDEALDLALEHTPFPATVCGYLCPNLCMQGCTKTKHYLPAVDVTVLGRAGRELREPMPAAPTGKKVAIIGGGAGGLSTAWQLWLRGHGVTVFDRAAKPGGKMAAAIPHSRFPKDIFDHELARIADKITYKKLTKELDRKKFLEIRDSHDYTIVAVGAQVPRMLKIKGFEKALTALDFLMRSKLDDVQVGRNVVIIGAGNVGCDVATEAHRLGAKDVTLIDIQEPASFGKEREEAEKIGAKFLWPVSAKAITGKKVELADGRVLKADTVVFAMGDQPDLAFLPDTVETVKGYIRVDGTFRTTDPLVFAIGDTVKPGLLTDAIGAGKKAALTIDARLRGVDDTYDSLPPIDTSRVRLEYYDPRVPSGDTLDRCSLQCASCGSCRDCGVCEALCPQQAISRRDLQQGGYEYVVDDRLCIGCGFCAGACPCGIWELRGNDPLE